MLEIRWALVVWSWSFNQTGYIWSPDDDEEDPLCLERDQMRTSHNFGREPTNSQVCYIKVELDVDADIEDDPC